MRNTISFLIDGEPITVRAYICMLMVKAGSKIEF